MKRPILKIDGVTIKPLTVPDTFTLDAGTYKLEGTFGTMSSPALGAVDLAPLVGALTLIATPESKDGVVTLPDTAEIGSIVYISPLGIRVINPSGRWVQVVGSDSWVFMPPKEEKPLESSQWFTDELKTI